MVQIYSGRIDWPATIKPYVRSPLNGGSSVYLCPDLEADFYHQWSPTPTNSNDD